MEKQIIGIPLRGFTAHADSKSTDPSDLTVCSNLVFKRTTRGGGAELRKRYGGASLAKTSVDFGPSVTSGRKLATYDNERLLLSDDTLLSYSPNFTGWASKGGISGAGLTIEHIAELPDASLAATLQSLAAPDIAISGNLMAVAWTDTGTAKAGSVAIFDMTTGARVFQDTVMETALTAAGWVRVVALASSFMVVAAKGSTNQITANTITYVGLNWSGGSTAIVADLNASCKGDVTRNGANDSVLIAYHTTVPNFKILVINSNKTAGASTTVAQNPSQAIGWLHWDFSDGKAYYAYVSAAIGLIHGSTPVGAAPAATEFTADGAATAAAQVTGFRTGATNNLYIEVRAAATYNAVVKWWSTTTAGAVATLIRSVGIGARVFKVGAKYYLPFTYESSLQSTYFIGTVDGTGTRPVIAARALYGLGGGLSVTANVGGCPVLADGVTALVPVMRLSSKPAGTAFYGICLARVDFSGANLSSPKRVGDSLHLPGGAVRAYAGEGAAVDRTAELGFYLFPETPTLAQGGGGALTLLGSYQYAAVYAFTDNKGQVHRSAPSPLASITLTGANQTVTGTIPTLRVTEKRGLFSTTVCSVELYRTQAGGTTFYRVPTFIVGNDPTTDTVAFTDTSSDAVVGANEEIYTTGKVLPHIPAPSAKLMESWRNRLFLAGTENPLELWPSNEHTPGEGVSFSDALVVTMEADGGPITALCELDDRLLIFKRNSIYALGGNGPTLTGGDPYEQPVKVCNFVGAIGPAGMVKTRDGVMFQSARGIYLHTRGGETVFAGAAVETVAAVTGACVLEDEEQVRFTVANGNTLVYHYGLPDERGVGAWTTFTNQAAVDCMMWNGVFVRLASDGTVTEETIGAYSDPGGASYQAIFQTSWLNLTQFFGRFKLYGIQLLGEIMASVTMTFRLAYDYSGTVVETDTMAVTVATPMPLQVSPGRRRATAIRFNVSETSATQGFRISGLGLEVGIEPGAQKGGMEKFFT
ncbi:MAG: hypothetical protein LC640_09165 [Frankia sp.]|nr:hypothetical protein [Frankia sp.]